jgi:hypothetical protein
VLLIEDLEKAEEGLEMLMRGLRAMVNNEGSREILILKTRSCFSLPRDYVTGYSGKKCSAYSRDVWIRSRTARLS